MLTMMYECMSIDQLVSPQLMDYEPSCSCLTYV